MATVQALLLTLATLGQADETVLYDFTATWCGPCQQVAPTVHQLAAQGYPIRQIDIDRNPQLAQKYGVSSIPCFVMVVNGQEVARELGVVSAGRLQQMMAMGQAAAKRGNAGLARGPGQAGGTTFAAQSPDNSDPFSRARGSAPPVNTKPLSGGNPLGNSMAAAPVSGGSLDEQLLAATVRIKVQDPDGHSYGTGTIIHQTQGKALILTCAHLFRDSKGQGQLTLDLFGGQRPHGVPAQLLDYDLDRDVALLVMETSVPQQIAPVGLSNYPAKVGQPVFSVGCSNGDDPTVWTGQVTSIDKYLGPPNIQASGQPRQGRSGGGLFDAEGRLIGVCNAADPTDNEGLYAALGSIHALLTKHDLAYVATANGLNSSPASALASAAQPNNPAATMPGATMSDSMTAPDMDSSAPANPFSLAGGNSFSFPGVSTGIARDRESTSETNFADSTEIICLIRSKQNPNGAPKVVVISNASAEVLEWLAQQGTTRNGPQLTTQKVHQVQRPRLWEPMLRVRTQTPPGAASDLSVRNPQSDRTARQPNQPSAVAPGSRDIPWRPATIR